MRQHNPVAHYELAQSLYMAEQYEEAAVSCGKAISHEEQANQEQKRELARYLILSGMINYKLQEYDVAIS